MRAFIKLSALARVVAMAGLFGLPCLALGGCLDIDHLTSQYRVDAGSAHDAAIDASVAGDMATGPCQPSLSQCGANCVNVLADPRNCGKCGVMCPNPQVCNAGSCSAACGPGLTNCSGACVITAGDILNCGNCGIACNLPNSTYQCVGSRCAIVSCKSGWADCNTTPDDGCEANIDTDKQNCGKCKTVCTGGKTCQSGACQ